MTTATFSLKSEHAAWLNANAPKNEFAASLAGFLKKKGYLTDAQVACIDKALAKLAAPKPAAIVADAAPIEAAFAKAKGAGLKAPRLTLAGLVFKPAPASGKNPGAIYVTAKGEDGVYLGKLAQGSFLRSGSCSDDQADKIKAAIDDPKNAAIAYGKQYGRCALCNRDLSDAESVARGIGPICAGKYGW